MKQKNNCGLKALSLFILLIVSFSTTARSPIPSYSVRDVVFSKDNSQLIFRHQSPASEIIKMNTATGQINKRVPLPIAPNINLFAPTPDGFKFLAKTPRGIVVIHNGTGKVLRTLPYPANVQNREQHLIQSDDGVLLAYPAISPKSRKIFLMHTGSGKVIRTIDLLKSEKWQRYPIIKAMGFNHNRHLFAYEVQAESRSVLHVYDVNREQEIFKLALPNNNNETFENIRFSRNDRYLILNYINNKGIKLVDLHSKTLKVLNYNYSSFVGFTPDDRHLIIVQPYDKSISTVDLATAKSRRKLMPFEKVHGRFAWDVVQSSDRSLLALSFNTTDIDKTDQFLLINANTGKLLRHISAHE